MPPSPSLWETVSPPSPLPSLSPPHQLTHPPGCTPKALTHRIAKLKSVANGTGSLDNTPNTTPSKRGRPKKLIATAAENGTGTGHDDVDDDEEFTPVKKRGVKRTSDPDDDATPVKKARGKRAGKVKKEEKEENGEKGEVEMGESDGDALEGVEEGTEGMEDLPLGQMVKVENGVITVAAAGEED